MQLPRFERQTSTYGASSIHVIIIIIIMDSQQAEAGDKHKMLFHRIVSIATRPVNEHDTPR